MIFRPRKLPEIGRVLGQTLKEFKNSTKDAVQLEEKKEKHS